MRTFWMVIGCLLAMGCAPSEPPVSPPQVEPEVDPPVEPADPRYAQLPQPAPAQPWAPPEASRTQLQNGLSVWHMPQSSAPLVSLHLVLPKGSAGDPRGKEGLTLLAADLLDEGAGPFNALELSDELGKLATDYSSSGGMDHVLLSMDCLAENLDQSLGLLAEIVLRPRLLREEFERRKKHYEAEAIAARDDPHAARKNALARALFSGGYGSGAGRGTTKSLSTISYQDALRRAREITVPDGAHLTFSGAIDAAQVVAATQKHFGKWKGQATSEGPAVQPAPEGQRAFLVDFPGAAQSSLVIAKRAGGDRDPSYFAEEVMHQKLGGSFTGRINMNLREDKGYTYGAFSLFRRYKRAGYFAVAADVKTETTQDSIREVFRELSDVCESRPLTDQERDEAVEGMLLGYPLEFDQVSSAGYKLASLPLRGRPTDFWTTWPAKIERVSKDRANQAARAYCDPKAYIVVVAGDAKRVRPGLEALGLHVIDVDAEGELKASELSP